MKKFYLCFLSVIILCLGYIGVSCSTTQSIAEKRAKAEEISKKITDFKFLFKANYAYPLGYKSIYLSPYYDVKVSKDTIQAYLPYFGRAYVAPIHSDDSGIKFTSTKFEYKITNGKSSGNWFVEIKTQDTNRDFSLFFDIWENGSARLEVTNPNRQPISFQGYIE